MTTVSVLHSQLTTAGIPIEGVSDNGDGTYRVDYMTAVTPAQKTQAAGIVAAFNATAEQATLDGLEAGKVTAQTESEVWFAANAGALALFNLAMATLETELNALVDACLPLATAANRTKLKRLLMAGAVLDRAQVKRDGLG